MSDVEATTQTTGAAADTESQFQSFWDAGAFDSTDEPPREDAQAAQTADDAPPADEPRVGDDPPADDAAKSAETAEEEAPQAQSLDELLASLKIDPQSARALNVPVKIDGVEKLVPLQDVLKSYQLEGHVNNKSIELSNQKVQFEQERDGWRQATQQALQQHQQMGQLALQMLNHDFSQVDWNTLRSQNPGEFAALQAEYANRQQQIAGFLQNVQAQQAQESQHQQQLLQQAIAQERERLVQAVPEWQDQKAFTEAQGKMVNYARSLGFKDAELNQIYDHRYMRILHDAARYQELQAAKPQALKQVRQAPAMAKPGSRTDTNPAAAKRQQVMDRLSRNPRDQDAQAAAFEFFAN